MCVCSKSAEKLFMDFGEKALSPFLWRLWNLWGFVYLRTKFCGKKGWDWQGNIKSKKLASVPSLHSKCHIHLLSFPQWTLPSIFYATIFQNFFANKGSVLMSCLKYFCCWYSWWGSCVFLSALDFWGRQKNSVNHRKILSSSSEIKTYMTED